MHFILDIQSSYKILGRTHNIHMQYPTSDSSNSGVHIWIKNTQYLHRIRNGKHAVYYCILLHYTCADVMACGIFIL